MRGHRVKRGANRKTAKSEAARLIPVGEEKQSSCTKLTGTEMSEREGGLKRLQRRNRNQLQQK